MITDKEDLKIENISSLKPRYIFFPHWSSIVPEDILSTVECVCFHSADLPFGRGGSPVQNLIDRGHRETFVTALKMTKEMDAGPVYFKIPVSLEGLADEIFIRISSIIADMIKVIIADNPEPFPQEGEPTVFPRRKPSQSRITNKIDTLEKMFDHIRMLDSDEYPRAFLELGKFRFEFNRPALKSGRIVSDVIITEKKHEPTDGAE